ncbi:MAG: TonB family protein [Bryobacteraceae bacterium]|nr:TonB family protein [Bryobacteraceae bacterium]
MENLPLFFTQWMVRALALVAVAGVASLAMRKAGAAVRHAVWIAAAAGMLMLPVLQLTAPELRVPVWIERAAPASDVVIEPLPLEVPEGAVVTSVPPQPQPKPVDYGAILLAVYLAGVALLLARQAASSVKLRRLVREAATVEPDSLAEAAQAVGYTGRLPEIRECGAVRVPFTCGAGEPVIILPADWREWPPVKLFAVLAHETAHVARRDWLTARLAAVNKAVNWWNPAAWWLERHLAAEAEEAVDEMALAAVGDVKQYASAVVDFAIAMQGQRLGSMEATAMARSTKVGRRVERILASNAAGVRSLRRSAVLMIAAAAVPLVVLAASALPEVRHVGPSEQLAPVIQTPAGPEIQRQVTAMLQAPATPEIQRNVTAMLQAGQTQQASPSPEALEAIAKMESVLAKEPMNAVARGVLMNQYRAAGLIEKARQQAWWLVENAPNQPQSVVASVALLNPGPLAADEEGKQRIQTIWRRHAGQYPADPMVQSHAAAVARALNSLFEAESLLQNAVRLAPDNEQILRQLAMLYYSALPEVGAIMASIPEAQAFRAKAVSELETSTDPRLVGLAGEMLAAGRSATVTGNDPEREAAILARLKSRTETAVKYLKRAQSLDPENPRWQTALQRASGEPQIIRIPAPEPGVMRISVGGNVQRAKLKREVRPEYPALAKQARIQGTVRFSVLLATDGTVKNITLLGGHPLLVQAATEAVKQWVFNTTLLNGEPVEVVTEVDLNFTRSGNEDQAQARPTGIPSTSTSPPDDYRIGGGIGVGGGGDGRAEATGEVHRIGGGVSAPVPIHRVQPDFPKGVSPEIQHTLVLLSIVIGKDGSVTSLEPLRGDPAFFENAIAAVKQWKFTPAMKGGEPLPVKANVEVNFRKF